MKKPVCWFSVFAIWVLGAFVLQQIWNYQKSLPDPLGSYIEFAIMFFVTFYVLALLPIKACVDWFFRLCGLDTVTNQDSET
jgi:hypothetical protein